MRSKKGVALITALGVTILLLILTAAIIQLVIGYYTLQQQQIDRVKGYYLSELGRQHAAARLYGGWTPTGSTTYTIARQGADYIVSEIPEDWTVTVTVTSYPNNRYTVDAKTSW